MAEDRRGRIEIIDGRPVRVVRLADLNSEERVAVLALIAAKQVVDQEADPTWQQQQLRMGRNTLRRVRDELRSPGASRSASAASEPAATSRT